MSTIQICEYTNDIIIPETSDKSTNANRSDLESAAAGWKKAPTM